MPIANPRLVFTAMLLCVGISVAFAEDLCSYAGNGGNERFYTTFELSDHTILVGGMASDLTWIPSGVAKVVLSKTCGTGGDVPVGDTADATQGVFAFIIRLSSDAQTIMKAYYFPAGFGGCIQTIKSNSVPGQATGDLYISGFWTRAGDATPVQYWLGKLDNNIIAGDPARLAWIYTDCAAGGDKFAQLWDVGGDGKVVFSWYKNPSAGAWHVLHRLKVDGSGFDTVAHWWDHGEGYAASVSLKPGNGDMRSLSQADYDLVTPDGHDAMGRKKGRYPYDFYFKGPKGVNDADGGFTGYSSDGMAATTVAVSVDRRDNTMYVGFNNGNPQNGHDFEPMVVAFKSTGELRWYSHLYTVWNDSNANNSVDAGETFQCPPDQYIDGLAIDYSHPVTAPGMVVLARCHGNAPHNFWSGVNSFHNTFTGSNGNEHLSWLGRLNGIDGSFVNASWQAEYDPFQDVKWYGAPYADPNLDGWPNHNDGWASLKSTISRSLTIDELGNVMVLATSRGPVTTANAFQKATKPNAGLHGCWSDFVRVFTPNFSTLLYSSVLSDPWDPVTGNNGGNIKLTTAIPVGDGLVMAGYHAADPLGVPLGVGSMPTVNVPAWGSTTPLGESAVLAKLTFTRSTPVYVPRINDRRLGVTVVDRGKRVVADFGGLPRQVASMEVFDARGKLLYSARKSGNVDRIEVNTHNAGSGFFVVRVVADGATHTRIIRRTR